jgi:Sec-independent protein translocase protein TatA
MELFNVGILEFLFVIVLAFIVLGPKKAIKIAGEVGAWIRDFLNSPMWKDIMKTSRDIRDIPRKITDDAEIQRALKGIDESIYKKKEKQVEEMTKGEDTDSEQEGQFKDRP